MVLSTGIFVSAFCICFLKYCKDKQWNRKEYGNIFQRIYEKKEVVILLFFVMLTRIGQLGTTPRWDSESYLQAIINACRAFDFTISSYLQSFRLCNHTTLGYSLFLAIGEYLNPDGVYGINVINLILVLFFTYFLYEILRFIFPEVSKTNIALGTFLILVEPLACGTFGNINVDFPVMIFSIFIVYMHIRKYYLLFGFFTIMLIQSKEVGIVILVGYMLSYLLLVIISGIKKGKVGALRGKILIVATLCIALTGYLLALKSGKANSWTNGVQFGLSAKNQSHYFAFVPEYVILKLKMIFLMNFYWLFTVIIIAGIFCIGIRRYKKEWKVDESLFPIIAFYGGLGTLLVFNCFYVTWSNPRYHYTLEMGLFLGGTIVILTGLKNLMLQKSILLILSILCLCESYTTVDIVTMKVFDCRSTGTIFPVAHPAWNAQYNKYYPAGILKDMAVYNNQLGYLDKGYDKILEEVRYSEEMDVVIWDKEASYNGFSALSMNRYWSPAKGKRTFIDSLETVSISVIEPDNIEKLSQEEKLKKEAVYIYTEGYGIEEEYALNELKEYYVIGEQKSVGTFLQGRMKYYKLRLK